MVLGFLDLSPFFEHWRIKDITWTSFVNQNSWDVKLSHSGRDYQINELVWNSPNLFWVLKPQCGSVENCARRVTTIPVDGHHLRDFLLAHPLRKEDCTRYSSSDSGNLWTLTLVGFPLLVAGAKFWNFCRRFGLRRFFSVPFTIFDIFI